MPDDGNINDHTFGNHWYDRGKEILRNVRSPNNDAPRDARSFNRKDHTALEFLKNEKELTADSETSKLIFVHEDHEVSVSVTPDTADSARIEVTLAPVSKIKDGDADFSAWSPGDIAESASTEIQESVTAVRLVATAGSAAAQLRVRTDG